VYGDLQAQNGGLASELIRRLSQFSFSSICTTDAAGSQTDASRTRSV